jgi:hypothetical protein
MSAAGRSSPLRDAPKGGLASRFGAPAKTPACERGYAFAVEICAAGTRASRWWCRSI